MDEKLEAPTGQRSPRWAVWKRMVIPCRMGDDGEAVPYLARLRIVQTPFFGIYLHDIYESDGDPFPHDHPWTFVSIILRGEYIEHLHPFPHVAQGWMVRRQHWKKFSIHRMRRDTAHRIAWASEGLKTLIITGPRKGDWGFFTNEGWVQWKEYEDKHRHRRPN